MALWGHASVRRRPLFVRRLCAGRKKRISTASSTPCSRMPSFTPRQSRTSVRVPKTRKDHTTQTFWCRSIWPKPQTVRSSCCSAPIRCTAAQRAISRLRKTTLRPQISTPKRSWKWKTAFSRSTRTPSCCVRRGCMTCPCSACRTAATSSRCS